MYEEYFGLERPPFKITPDTSLFYEGGKRGDILLALAYAVSRGEGIIKVVGEVGSGKTMLCRMLQLQLPDTVEIVYIANPSVSAEDILFVIAHELALPVDKGASKHEVMHMLQDYLLQRHMEDKQVVLFVEEAQGMPLETLEEIRLLSNLETDQNKLLQIILFGQPELDENLSNQSIRQLRERITHNFILEPLTQEEIHNYLNFRMREVGYTGPELVNRAVAKKIELHSEGLLRRINIIADKILLSAFAEGTHNLSAKHVTAAVNDSTFGQDSSRQLHWMWWFLPLLVLTLTFLLFQSRAHWMPWTQAYLQPAMMDAPAPAAELPSDTGAASAVEDPVVAADTPVITASDPVVVALEPADANQAAAVEAEAEPAAVAVEADAPPAPQASVTAAVEREESEIETLTAEVEVLVSEIEVAVKQAEVAEKTTGLEQTAAQSTNQAQQPAVNADAASAAADVNRLTGDYRQWLNAKLEQSKRWLSGATRNRMSIQVMMRSKSAAPDLVYYLRNEWPLDIGSTYVYEYTVDERSIYRVFYGEYGSLAQAKSQIEKFPESVKMNSPYVHSVYRMQSALL